MRSAAGHRSSRVSSRLVCVRTALALAALASAPHTHRSTAPFVWAKSRTENRIATPGASVAGH